MEKTVQPKLKRCLPPLNRDSKRPPYTERPSKLLHPCVKDSLHAESRGPSEDEFNASLATAFHVEALGLNRTKAYNQQDHQTKRPDFPHPSPSYTPTLLP